MSTRQLQKKNSLTKKEMTQAIARDSNMSRQDVSNVVESFLDKIVQALINGDKLKFRKLGTFEVVERKQRVGKNFMKSAESVIIPAHHAVKFTPSKQVRALLKSSHS